LVRFTSLSLEYLLYSSFIPFVGPDGLEPLLRRDQIYSLAAVSKRLSVPIVYLNGAIFRISSTDAPCLISLQTNSFLFMAFSTLLPNSSVPFSGFIISYKIKNPDRFGSGFVISCLTLLNNSYICHSHNYTYTDHLRYNHTPYRLSPRLYMCNKC